jgi:RimJ/RimL family protein N-acetyltransferase
MNKYKCLPVSEFSSGSYKLTSLRNEDRYEIMNWRNEQITILRQKKPLTKEDQDKYFNDVISTLFQVENPKQILFSFLKGEYLIGYGGLVHIDWESKNGEISFLVSTNRSLNKALFEADFSEYLSMIVTIAFSHLMFIKLTTTVYNVHERHDYIEIIEKFGFKREGLLEKQIFIQDELRSVFIYSYFRPS